MSKRFTDTNKWRKRFFRELHTDYKLLWLYILDNVNHAGIWEVDIDLANFEIKGKVERDKAIQLFNQRIVVIDADGNEKWFLPDFIIFQYGELTPNNRLHQSVIAILEKYAILDFFNEYISQRFEGVSMGLPMGDDTPIYTRKKIKDKEKDKEENNTRAIVPANELVDLELIRMSQKEYDLLVDNYGIELTRKAIDVVENYCLSKGKKYKSYYRAILNWGIDEAKKRLSSNGNQTQSFTNKNQSYVNDVRNFVNNAHING